MTGGAAMSSGIAAAVGKRGRRFIAVLSFFSERVKRELIGPARRASPVSSAKMPF